MFKFITNAIESLTIYAQTDAAISFAKRYPYEAKRRQNYLNNLSYQLILFLRDPKRTLLKLVIDDIKNCLAQDFYANEAAMLTLDEDDSFAKFLQKILVNLHTTYRLLTFADKVRVKIKKQFTQLPIALMEFLMNLNAIQSFIESKLSVANKLLPETDVKAIALMRGCKHLNMVYQNYICHNDLDPNLITYQFLYPIYFYNDPLNENNNQQLAMEHVELQKHTECYLKQTYLNISLTVNYYHERFKQFSNIQSIGSIKDNIKNLQLALSHAARFITDVSEHINEFHDKLNMLWQKDVIKSEADLEWHTTMFNTIKEKFLMLSMVVDALSQTCMSLFAYIFDETLTTKTSNKPSRLDLLLSNKPFIPIPEKVFRDAKGLTNLQQKLCKNAEHLKQSVLQ